MSKSNFDDLLKTLPKFAEILKRFPENIQEKVFDTLLHEYYLTNNQTPPPQNNTLTTPINNSNNLPTYNALTIKGIVGTESEWLLLISNKLSIEKQMFSVENIREEYIRADRYVKNNKKNFKNNLSTIVKNDFISETSDDNYILLPKGVEKVKEILARTAPVIGRKGGSKKKKTNKKKNN